MTPGKIKVARFVAPPGSPYVEISIEYDERRVRRATGFGGTSRQRLYCYPNSLNLWSMIDNTKSRSYGLVGQFELDRCHFEWASDHLAIQVEEKPADSTDLAALERMLKLS